MAKRKNITKKVRFEIFKRDSFTCQYCGRMAPDVVLEVDHINPVANGGDNDIMNLITSCAECNRGKGAKKLTDKQEIVVQQEQLKELNKKREQMNLMLQWKKELSKLMDEQVDAMDGLLQEKGRSLTEKGRQDFCGWIKRYGFSDVYDAFEISLQQYGKEEDSASWSKAIEYVPRIINNKRRQSGDPLLSKKFYIRGILRNRDMNYNEKRLWNMLNNVCLNESTCLEVSDIAKTCRNWTSFWKEINECFEGEW